jgi:hypothetical protein
MESSRFKFGAARLAAHRYAEEKSEKSEPSEMCYRDPPCRGRTKNNTSEPLYAGEPESPSIYSLRTLRSDESAAYIALVRTSDSSARDTDGDDLRSAGIWMPLDCGDYFFTSNPMDDFPFRLRK